jgi:hypothetical protein
MIRFINRGLLLLTLSALGFALPRPVHADGLPKGEDILDKYVAATGGKEAYEKIKNRVLTGTMEISGQLKGKITIYQAAPNKMLTIAELGGIGKIEDGTDGKTVWERNPVTGPRVKTGEEKANALRDATLDGEVQWRKLYKKVACVAEEKIDGKPCYKLELTTPEGKVRTAYYDKQSNLLVKIITTEKSPMGDITVEATQSDYKKVDGLLIPHKLNQKAAGQDIVIVIEKVEQNVKLPDNRFDLPDDIKKLAEKEKK